MRMCGSLRPFIYGLVFAIVFCATGERASAQEGSAGASDFSLYVGSLLPNQIDGVTEILPVWGARYGLGTQLGTVEFGGSNTHAQGVDFTTLTVSLRGDIPVADQTLGLIYGGLDLNYYQPVNETSRQTVTGVHIGTGLMVKVVDTLWLRADLKFMGGPGTSLYLAAGLVFRPSGAP